MAGHLDMSEHPCQPHTLLSCALRCLAALHMHMHACHMHAMLACPVLIPELLSCFLLQLLKRQ
jgi:hypothetical protein